MARRGAGQPALSVADVEELGLSNHTGHIRTLKDRPRRRDRHQRRDFVNFTALMSISRSPGGLSRSLCLYGEIVREASAGSAE
jgi:hypothetical protein